MHIIASNANTFCLLSVAPIWCPRFGCLQCLAVTAFMYNCNVLTIGDKWTSVRSQLRKTEPSCCNFTKMPLYFKNPWRRLLSVLEMVLMLTKPEWFFGDIICNSQGRELIPSEVSAIAKELERLEVGLIWVQTILLTCLQKVVFFLRPSSILRRNIVLANI